MRIREPYLCSDGKHAVRVSANTPDQMVKLLPQTKMDYEAMVRTNGTRTLLWKRKAHGKTKGNGHGNGREAPSCPAHKTPMA